MSYEFTDRYDALEIPRPDPETMCKGHCEGTGVYPHYVSEAAAKGGLRLDRQQEETPTERRAWQEAHDAPKAHEFDNGKCDGWHFIKCPECNGSGKR